MEGLGIGETLSIGFDAVALVVAVVAIFISLNAQKVSRKNAEAAQEAELAAMRLRAKEALAEVRNSYFEVKTACAQCRTSWEQHNDRHMPVLGDPLSRRTPAMDEISDVEHGAASMLKNLEERFGNLGQKNPNELEALIDSSSSAAMGIRSLVLRLQEPKPFRRW
ncbi:hypothetical protein [Ruegeria arenilitoris]|uniref:hypothetical protein n=1 Tax=Ruegeria arenilitoris TaxID=1173585 RepID=UPI0014816A9D|nr:hypothetical protein [Ruegeria arenilitoris]